MKEKILSFIKDKYDRLSHKLFIIYEYLYYSIKPYDKTYNINSSEFKMIDFNLRCDKYEDRQNNWKYRKDKIIDFITSEAPDVMCSQEVMPHMCKYIMNKIGNIYGQYSTDNKLRCKINYSPFINSGGNIIFYNKTKYKIIDKGRFWLSDTPKVPSSSWGNTTLRNCIYIGLQDNNGKIFYVFNTHFDHVSAESRNHSANLIVSKIKEIAKDNEIYLSGDFNTTINSKEMSPLNRLFDNTYNHNMNKTFNAFQTKTKTIDAIYYNFGNNFRIEIPNIKISDHSPIIITFQ